MASLEDGIDVVLTGVAVWRSAKEHRLIKMDELRGKVWK
jgi:hypothetical protein